MRADLLKDYTVMGDVANIAARAQGMAGPGEIIVNEDVYQQIQSEFPEAEKRNLDVKGISHLVVA